MHPTVRAYREYYKHGGDTDTGVDGRPLIQWDGHACLQMPQDLILMQEILHEEGIRSFVELGVSGGGLGTFLKQAKIVDFLIGVDIDDSLTFNAYNVFVQGDTLSHDTLRQVYEQLWKYWGDERRPLCIMLDDGHSQEHVAAELAVWVPLLKPGDLLIVGDMDTGGPWWGLRSVMECAEKWKLMHDMPDREVITFDLFGHRFEAHASSWKYHLTAHGWYRCIL